MTIDTTNKVTVEIAEAAAKEITRCTEHAAAVYRVWTLAAQGTGREQERNVAKETLLSWNKAMTTLLTGGWGPADVFRDGDLSFTVSTPSIFFGLIFHKTGAPDRALEGDVEVEPNIPLASCGRYCSEQVDAPKDHVGDGLHARPGQVYCLLPIREGKCPTHGEDRAGTFALPIPGTWSFHS